MTNHFQSGKAIGIEILPRSPLNLGFTLIFTRKSDQTIIPHKLHIYPEEGVAG
jgi:hypothetical protein